MIDVTAVLPLLAVFLPFVVYDGHPVSGQLTNRDTGEAVENHNVWFCEVIRDYAGDVFICETSKSPYAITDELGHYRIKLAPGEYVPVISFGEQPPYDVIKTGRCADPDMAPYENYSVTCFARVVDVDSEMCNLDFETYFSHE